MVEVGKQVLRFAAAEPFDEFLRFGRALAEFGYTRAGHIHMRAFALLVGKENADGQVGLFVHQAAVVIGVGNAHIAAAGADGFKHSGVVGKRRRGQIGHPAFYDLLGFHRAEVGNHGAHQRLVIHIIRGAQTQAPFPFCIGQRGIARKLGGLHFIGVVENGAGAHG